MTIKVPKVSPYPPNPAVPRGEALGREKLNTLITYLEDINAPEPKKESVRLPNFQPWYPKQWDSEAWRPRTVFGTDKFHIFKPSMPYAGIDSPFILRVSRRQDGQWFYEDFDDLTPELEGELEQFISDLDDALKREPTGLQHLRDLKAKRPLKLRPDDAEMQVLEEDWTSWGEPWEEDW